MLDIKLHTKVLEEVSRRLLIISTLLLDCAALAGY